MNAAIASKFPSPSQVLHRLDPLGSQSRVEGLPLCLNEDALQLLKSFQRDTIIALADCLIVCAAGLESKNLQVTPEELKRQARVLLDYAETLTPAAPEATR